MSSDDSHTVLSHSIVVAPQMSLTSTCRAPCSASMRSTSAATSSGTRWSTCDGDARARRRRRRARRSPRSSRAGPSPSAAARVVRPGAVDGGAGGAELRRRCPGPAPRVAPATSATLPSRVFVCVTGIYSFVSDDDTGGRVTGQVAFDSYEDSGVVVAVDLVNALALERAFGRPVAATDPLEALRQILAIDPPSAARPPPARRPRVRRPRPAARQVFADLHGGDVDAAADRLNALLADAPRPPAPGQGARGLAAAPPPGRRRPRTDVHGDLRRGDGPHAREPATEPVSERATATTATVCSSTGPRTRAVGSARPPARTGSRRLPSAAGRWRAREPHEWWNGRRSPGRCTDRQVTSRSLGMVLDAPARPRPGPGRARCSTSAIGAS